MSDRQSMLLVLALAAMVACLWWMHVDIRNQAFEAAKELRESTHDHAH